jgi:molecular chaperone DnaJ
MPLAFNPYEVLGVSKEASQDEVKKAFKRKAMEYHPDKTNGDAAKVEIFKNINEANSILSDPEQRQRYDAGLYDLQNGGNPGPGFDPFEAMFNFQEMFGGGGPFGASFQMHQRPKRKGIDLVTINLTVNDIYYGTTKKVEFELLDKCQKCAGSGANDASQIVKCMMCSGSGMYKQKVNPFMITATTCPSCQGKGEIRTGKPCGGCKGEKTTYRKRAFELKLPKGINQSEMHMENKGAYNCESGEFNDIVFKFLVNIPPEYKIDSATGNVEYTHKITIDDLIGGFDAVITIFNEKITLVSEGYFNPNRKFIIRDKGMYCPNIERNGDLFIIIGIEFTDSEKLTKYREILQKLYKRPPVASDKIEDNAGLVVRLST